MTTVQRWLSTVGDGAIEDYPPLAVLARWVAALAGANGRRALGGDSRGHVIRCDAGGGNILRLGPGDAAGRHVRQWRRTDADRATAIAAEPDWSPWRDTALTCARRRTCCPARLPKRAHSRLVSPIVQVGNADCLVLNESELALVAPIRGGWARLNASTGPSGSSTSTGCITTPRACSSSPRQHDSLSNVETWLAADRLTTKAMRARLDVHLRAALHSRQPRCRRSMVHLREGTRDGSPSPARDRRHPAPSTRPPCPRGPGRRPSRGTGCEQQG